MNREWLHWLKTTLNCPGDFVRTVSVSGGCMHQAYRVEGSAAPVFLKLNRQERAGEIFRKEALGLDVLRRQDTSLLVPATLFCGTAPDGSAVLVLEWITQAPASTHFWEHFGQALAQLHRCTQEKFGLQHDNYIGSLQQINTLEADWATFYIQHRIISLMEAAVERGMFSSSIWKSIDVLYKVLETDFPAEAPALLHGDLWSGNFLSHSSGSAAIFDPAVYYGHRETEMAFTELFGGFHPAFYEAYRAAYPLKENFRDRIAVHQLYPLLVHALLFGSHYIEAVKTTLSPFR